MPDSTRARRVNQPRNNIKNHILARLPAKDYERIAPHLEQVEFASGQTLYAPGELIKHVYFPINSMISLVSRVDGGAGVEVGLIGSEGMTGVSLALGVDRSPYEAMVQLADGALRMSAKALLTEFKRGGALQTLLLRHTQSLLFQISQVAACNRLHLIEERLARWLLMSHDRYRADDLPLTHEFLSLMLGVRRAGVTNAALALQAEDLIEYRRGHVKLTDRKGLEDYACDCYKTMKTEFDKLSAYIPIS